MYRVTERHPGKSQVSSGSDYVSKRSVKRSNIVANNIQYFTTNTLFYRDYTQSLFIPLIVNIVGELYVMLNYMQFDRRYCYNIGRLRIKFYCLQWHATAKKKQYENGNRYVSAESNEKK